MPSYMEAETSVRVPQRGLVSVLERTREAKRYSWFWNVIRGLTLVLWSGEQCQDFGVARAMG